MAIQLNDLFTEFTALKQDTSNLPGDTYIYWCNYVARFLYNRLIGTDPERYIATQAYSALTGAQDLPDDFKNLRPRGAGIFYLNNDGSNTPTDNKLPITQYGSEFPGYFLTNTEVNFTNFEDPMPVMMRYIPKLTKYTSVNNYFTIDGTENGIEILEDEYIDYLISALDVWYGVWDGDPSAEAMSDQRFIQSLSEILDNFKRIPRAMGIKSPSRIF